MPVILSSSLKPAVLMLIRFEGEAGTTGAGTGVGGVADGIGDDTGVVGVTTGVGDTN